MYYRDAHAAIVLYDVTSAKSLEDAEQWITELKEGGPTEIIIIMAGNKMEAPQNKR
jgi:GTPase SAR1 family protein